MLKTAGFLSLVACLVLLPLLTLADAVEPGAATDTSSAGFVSVNGMEFSKDEFVHELERVPVQTTMHGKEVALPAGQYVIQKLITETLIKQLAEQEGVAPTDSQVDSKLAFLIRRPGGDFAKLLRQLGATEQDWKRQMMLQQSVINVLIKNLKVSDAEIRSYYDAECKRSPSKFYQPAARRIGVILTKTKARIDRAYVLLQKGESFGSVATRMSEDKTTAPYGGVVGWLSMDMSVVPKPIRTTAFSLQVGKYSRPFLVQDKKDKCWLIVRVEQKRPAVKEGLDDVKDLIREQIALQKADRKAFEKKLQDFIIASRIEVNEERYQAIPDMIKKDTSLPASLTKSADPGK